jgi:predicted ATPase
MVFPFIFGQFTFANCRGRQAVATASADMLLTLAEQMRYEAARVIGHRLKGMLALGRSELIEAKAQLERSIALYAADRDAVTTQTFGQNALVHSQALLSLTLFVLGDVEPAIRIGREALAAADDLRHPHSTAIALSYVGGHVFGYCGAIEHLMRHSRRNLDLCDQHDLRGFRPHALGFLGWGLAEQGEIAEGVARMESAVRAFDAMDYTLGVAAHLAHLADALRRAGRLEEAKAVSARAIENMQAYASSGWAEADIIRVDALIELERPNGDRRETLQRLLRAAHAARAIGSPVFERRCLVSLVEAGGDSALVDAAEQRLRALAHLDRLPELVEAVMSEAGVPA